MTIEAPRPGLEAAERERFARDGFLFPFRVLSREAADVERGRVLSLLDEHDEDPELDDYLGYKANLVFRWVDNIVHETCLLDAVEDLLGPDLLLWSCSLLLKPPHSRGRYTWHQDATYWGMEPPSAVSAWLALGDVGPENGGLRCLPGLHARGQLAHENTFAEDVMLPRGQELRDLDQDTIDGAVGHQAPVGRGILPPRLHPALLRPQSQRRLADWPPAGVHSNLGAPPGRARVGDAGAGPGRLRALRERAATACGSGPRRPRRPPGRDDPNGHLAGGAESAPVARRSANERVRELVSSGAKRQTANQSDGPFPPSGRNFGKGFPLARE